MERGKEERVAFGSSNSVFSAQKAISLHSPAEAPNSPFCGGTGSFLLSIGSSLGTGSPGSHSLGCAVLMASAALFSSKFQMQRKSSRVEFTRGPLCGPPSPRPSSQRVLLWIELKTVILKFLTRDSKTT